MFPSLKIFTNPAARAATSFLLGKAIEEIETAKLAENRWQPKAPKKENGSVDTSYKYQPLISLGQDDDAVVNITQAIKTLKDMLMVQRTMVRETLQIKSDFKPSTEPSGILEYLYSKYLKAYSVAWNVLCSIEELSELEILKQGVKIYNALLCGVWNGLVDAVSGLFAMVKMIYDGITLGQDFVQNIDKYLPTLLEQFDEALQAIENISFSDTAKYIYGKLKQINLTFDPVACAYFVGYVYGFIISLIIEIVVGILISGGVLDVAVVIQKLQEVIFGIFRLGWGMAKGAVKAVRTFSKFVVKSVKDLIKGFQELLNFLKKGWEEIKQMIDELFIRLKNIKNEKRIKPRSNYFNSIADPVADILGAASKSHPERLKNIMLDLKNKGVEIVFRSDEALGYSPGLSKGQPGQVIIHENASISAWEHEYIHFLNDQENGFLGMSSLFDSNYRVYTELNAYTKEIEFVKSLPGNNQNVIKQLKLNFDDKLNYIINNFGKVQDKNLLSKIEIFKNL